MNTNTNEAETRCSSSDAFQTLSGALYLLALLAALLMGAFQF